MDYAATILSKLPGASKRDHGMRRLVDTLQTYLPQEQIDAVNRAYEFGAAAHEGQTRICCICAKHPLERKKPFRYRPGTKVPSSGSECQILASP